RVARIEADRSALVGALRAAHRMGDEGLEQCRGDVVDAVEVQVLEHVQGHALAGAGQSAQNDDAHGGPALASYGGADIRRATPGLRPRDGPSSSLCAS